VYDDTRQLLMNNPVNQGLLKAVAPTEKKMRRQTWQLEILKDVPAAKLTIHGFGGKSGPDFQKRFGRFLAESFRELKKKNVPNLIIDLRTNGGGYDAGGVALFSYLISKPTRYYGRQHTVTDGSSTYLQFADVSAEDIANEKKGMVREADGTYTLKRDFDQGVSPNPDHYTGKVYFLVSGQSGSTTAEFTAVAHYNKLGTFIGEETGGAYCGGNGSSFIRLTLPHSKIFVNIPLVYYQMAVEGDCAAGRGTLPDHPVKFNPDAFHTFEDNIMQFTKELIKGQGQDVRKNR
jgi:C-terminal processing protease CtpA/Prc